MGQLETHFLREGLSSHQNFSFNSIERELWQNADLSRSLFNGSIFVECVFNGICFDNADLEGTRFSKCKFTDCTFLSADIHSIWVVECQFDHVRLNDANIIDCTFHKCNFIECTFNGIGLMQSDFEDCYLDPFEPNNSSITLNHFIKTTFKRASFRNVFYYQMFEACEFQNSSFEAYLLGYVYGLSPQNYKDLNCILMGDSMVCTLEETFDDILTIYMDRRMYLNIGFLQLGRLGANTDKLLLQCVELLKRFLQEDHILKSEQIKFLQWIIDYLHNKEEIAPATYLLLENALSSITRSFDANPNTAWEKAHLYVRELRNSLYFIFLKYLDKMNIPAISSPKPVTLIASFEVMPSIPLIQIMESLAPDSSPPIQLKTERGSFIEWISCDENIVNCIELFLQLIGSIAIPFITLGIENKIQSKKEQKQKKWELEKEKEATMKTVATTSETITIKDRETGLPLFITQTVSPQAGASVTNAMRVIVDLNILDDQKRFGYNAQNIREMKIIPYSTRSNI